MHSHFSKSLWGGWPGSLPPSRDVPKATAFYTVAPSSLPNSEGIELAFLMTSGCSSEMMWLFIITFKRGGVKEETPGSLSFSNHHVLLAKSKVGKAPLCRSR